MYHNKDLMPSYPPEGIGPYGVPIGDSLPGSRKKGYSQSLNPDKTGAGY